MSSTPGGSWTIRQKVRANPRICPRRWNKAASEVSRKGQTWSFPVYTDSVTLNTLFFIPLAVKTTEIWANKSPNIHFPTIKSCWNLPPPPPLLTQLNISWIFIHLPSKQSICLTHLSSAYSPPLQINPPPSSLTVPLIASWYSGCSRSITKTNPRVGRGHCSAYTDCIFPT